MLEDTESAVALTEPLRQVEAIQAAMKKTLIVLAVLVIAPVVLWKLIYPTFTYRYRLTIEAEVDGEARRGSSVVEVWFRRQPQIGHAPEWREGARGQGAAVDLGSRGVLVSRFWGGWKFRNVSKPFLFLRAHPRYRSRPASFPPDREGLREAAANPLRQYLHPGNLPAFAWLPDPNDRTSAQLVEPVQLPWEVAPGIRILGVQIETTDAPLTKELGSCCRGWLLGGSTRKRQSRSSSMGSSPCLLEA